MQITDPDKINKFIEESAYGENILPITSICDTGCIFCSRGCNPPEIHRADIGLASLEQIFGAFEFLDPGIPIIIGESAGIIEEGEPTLHPDFPAIFERLIEHFPNTPVEMKTNGRNLDRNLLDLLKKKDNLKLDVYLNSASARGRKLLMNESSDTSARTLENIKLLSEYGIAFSGSIIAFPNITGWEDIRLTLKYFSDNKAETVRVHPPSHSRYADAGVFPDSCDFIFELKDFINSIRDEIDCPVLVDPSVLTDLTPEVSGMLKNSPAWDAGIRSGDIILSVNSHKPMCRTDAWNRLSEAGRITAAVKSDGVIETLEWDNPRQFCSGITMEFDFVPSRADRLRQVIEYTAGKVYLLTSESGFELIRSLMQLFKIEKDKAEVIKVMNQSFGGTINVSGLLTVDDFLAVIHDNHAIAAEASLIILPYESFSCSGNDLKFCHFTKIRNETGIDVITL